MYVCFTAMVDVANRNGNGDQEIWNIKVVAVCMTKKIQFCVEGLG